MWEECLSGSPLLRVETQTHSKFVKFTTSRHPGCPCKLCVLLGEYTEPFLHAATLVPSTAACSSPPSRPGHLHFFLPDSLSVFNPARRWRPSPLYPGLTWTGLRLTECPEACSASVGVWAPEGGKALLRSQEMGVGGVEAIEARRAWPIVTTGAMAIRSHGSAGRPNQEIHPVSSPFPRIWAL